MTAAAKAKVILPVAAAGLIVSLIVATQFVAHLFHYPREFGGGLVDVGNVRLYAPWDFVSWYTRFAESYPQQFETALIIPLAVFFLPAMFAIGVSRRRKEPRAFGTAAWATMDDVKEAKLLQTGPEISGRVLGSYKGRLLLYTGIEHAIIVGASRSGKGAGHVVPTLLAWGQSALIYDRKGELWHITAVHRKRFSHVMYFAPTDPNTVRWNPLFEVRKGMMEIADIQNIVGILVDPLGRKAGDLNFWDQSAAAFFTAVILHVLYSEPDDKKNLAHVRRLLINIDSTLEAMVNTPHREVGRDAKGQPIFETHPEVLLGATALKNMEAKVRSSVLSTSLASLELWADPLVEYATNWSDFTIGDLVCAKAPVSLYIVTPQAHADRLAFLVRVFARQTINSLMEDTHVDSRGRPKKHRLLLMLDEFPKLGSLPFLENAMGEMAGYGITAHLICQSFNDVFSKYGDRTPLFDNMHITVSFATSEPSSIEKVVKRAGKALELRESYSDPRSILGRSHRSTSQSEQQRYILSEEDVRGLPDRKQFIFVNNAKPLIADKIRYYEHPFFKECAGDYFHGELSKYQQKPGDADLPGKPVNDWLGLQPKTALPTWKSVRPIRPQKRTRPAQGRRRRT